MTNPHLLPANARVAFLLSQRSDLQNWACIPMYIGFIGAPLYDHRPALQQTAIILLLVAVSWPWARIFKHWIENRIGVFRSFASNATGRKRGWRQAASWAVLALVTAVMIFFPSQFPAVSSGWLDGAFGGHLALPSNRDLREASSRSHKFAPATVVERYLSQRAGCGLQLPGNIAAVLRPVAGASWHLLFGISSA